MTAPTPRTDALIQRDWHMPPGWKQRLEDHARELERDLSAANETIRTQLAATLELIAERDAAVKALQELLPYAELVINSTDSEHDRDRLRAAHAAIAIRTALSAPGDDKPRIAEKVVDGTRIVSLTGDKPLLDSAPDACPHGNRFKSECLDCIDGGYGSAPGDASGMVRDGIIYTVDQWQCSKCQSNGPIGDSISHYVGCPLLAASAPAREKP